jgi:hypothetical protein
MGTHRPRPPRFPGVDSRSHNQSPRLVVPGRNRSLFDRLMRALRAHATANTANSTRLADRFRAVSRTQTRSQSVSETEERT